MFKPLLVAGTLALTLAAPARAISLSLYVNQAAWQAAAGAETLQDFSSYSIGDSVLNTNVLPGVNATTNLGTLEIFNAAKGIAAFGTGASSRANGDAYYQFDLGNAYRAFALDVAAFESGLPPYNLLASGIDAGKVEILFADNFLISYDLFGNDGTQNIFFGVVSDTPITRVRWLEAHEQSGANEETRLDNLRVALPTARVPEPSSLALIAGGLLGWAARRRPAKG